MENHFDLIVVGAGPAGSSAAYAASKNGISVALLEKEENVANTVRTSGVTWIEDMDKLGIPKECYNPIKKYSFASHNNQVSIQDKVPHAAVLDVRKTYRFLAKQAEESGAKIYLKTNVVDVIKNNEGLPVGVIATKENEILKLSSKMIIDASGFQSIIAKSLGFVSQWKKFGAGAEYEVRAENVQHDNWWLMVGSKYSPSGYAWIFPVSKEIVRIGVGVGKPESKIDPTVRLKEIIEKKLGPIKDLGKIEVIEFHYGLIPNEGLSRQTVYDNLILVGDSAGQANPLVLEGIRYAIHFGRIAGEIAANGIKTNDTSARYLGKYEERWKKEIQSKIKSAGKVQDRWLSLSDEQWDKELDIIKELNAEEFVDFIKAEFGLGSIIKLATSHPKLAVRQLFDIVKGVGKKS